MTNQSLTVARSRLLAPNDLDERHLARTLEQLLSAKIDYADLYFQHSSEESWRLDDGIVSAGTFGISQGVGIRAVAGERSALAFSDDISLKAITQGMETTRSLPSATRDGLIRVGGNVLPATTTALYASNDPINSLDAAAKVAMLNRIDALARAADPHVIQVSASLTAVHDTVLIVRGDGHSAGDIRPLVRLHVSVVVERNGRRESGRGGGGARTDYSMFDDSTVENYVRRAVDSAMTKLDAIPAPAGSMTVVCAAGWPGVLLHEAVGHGLEGDFNRKRTSAFAGRMGEQVAAKGVTIVDDGTLPGLRGSLTIDDEGQPTECTTLIEDGVLTGLMQDSLNARLMGMAPTGNGRRESYAHMPMPRMTNTYMRAGDREPEEIIASVKHGIYAVDFAGGEVDITSGRFTFDLTEAYLIEDGRLTVPVKGATLIGNGPESLKRVSMIGNDLGLDSGIALCGKDGQTLPVGVGQPTLRLDEVTVGGTA